jgi:hypothetical protein
MTIPPREPGDRDFLQAARDWFTVGMIRVRPDRSCTVWRFDRPPFKSTGFYLGSFENIEAGQMALVKSLDAH